MFKRFPFIHNHGDFVHLDALREWLRGVVSLEAFLKSKDDKAIVKDMHFTDERTTVDYIDTKDDTEKSEVFCKYLTSDAFSLDDNTQFKKVDHIRYKVYPNNEKVIAVREKETGQFRDVIRSDCPIAYEATDDYMTSNKAVHIGIYDNGIKIYDDDYNKTSLLAKKDYQFCTTKTLTDCDPFNTMSNQNTNEITQLTKNGDFVGTCVGNVIICGQVRYRLNTPITIEAGKSVNFVVSPKTMGASNFSLNVYLKDIQCLNYNGIITSVSKNPNLPLDNTTPVYITLYNSSNSLATIEEIRFTF